MTGSLAGKRVLVTRAAEQGADLARLLAARGAEVEVIPLIAFADPSSWAKADQGIASLDAYDALVFTSVNGVDRFWQRLYAKLGTCDVVALPARARVFAVGPATAAALRKNGAIVEDVPEEHAGAALAGTLKKGLGALAGKRILLPRAESAADDLPEAVRAAGGSIDIAPVYRTIAPAEAGPALAALFARRAPDAVMLASASAATHLVDLLGGPEAARKALSGTVIAAIGPVTAARASELGIPPRVVPERYTADEMVSALERYF